MSSTAQQDEEPAVISLDPVSTAPQAARRFVQDQLADWSLLALADDVTLVASELVTNGLLHARSPLTVRLVLVLPGVVRLEVEDDDPHPISLTPSTLTTEDLEGLDEAGQVAQVLASETMTGRGLHVVSSVADAWGVETGEHAKLVWAEFGTGPRPGPGTRSIGGGESAGVAPASPADLVGPIELPGSGLIGLHGVRLIGVPVRLAMASDANLDDLIREFQVATLDEAPDRQTLPGQLVDLVRETLDRYADPRRESRGAARQAAAAGLRLLDVDLLLPPAAIADLRRMLEILDEVAAYCREGTFLSLAPSEELTAFRHWFVEEMARQIGGEPPQPCPFPTAPPPVVEQRAARPSPEPPMEPADPVAERLQRLQAVTARLSAAVDVTTAGEVIVPAAIAEMNGRTGSLCMLAPDGKTVEIVFQAGYDEAVTSHWRRFSVSDDTPASEAIRTGEVVWLRSSEDRDERYPIFRDTPVVGDDSVAVVPVIVPPGRAIAALVVGFGESRDPDNEDLGFLTALADQAGQALDRARLHQAERTARERFAFLAEASTVLNASLDATETLQTLAELAVPRLGDWCAVHVVGDDGQPRFVVAAHLDPAKRALAEEVSRRWPADLETSGVGECIRTGESHVFQVIGDEMLTMAARSEEHLQVLRSLGMTSGLVVPIAAAGRILGALSVVNTAGRAVDHDDLSLAQDIGIRAGAALANAQLFAERSAIAQSLQASLLPSRLPDDPRISFAARYVAAGQGLDVGGDFYDVFPVDDGWMVVVGDVRGHGVEAAAVTGLARHTIRALAGLQPSLTAILQRLNQVLLQAHGDNGWDDEPRFCSALLAHITVTGGDAGGPAASLRLASAGHPVPLVVRADGAIEAAEVRGDVLGVLADVALTDTSMDLAAGDTLLLFTDGVTERHVSRRFFDDTGVAAAASRVPGATAQEMVDAVEAACRAWVPSELADDMVILAVQLPRG